MNLFNNSIIDIIYSEFQKIKMILFKYNAYVTLTKYKESEIEHLKLNLKKRNADSLGDHNKNVFNLPICVIVIFSNFNFMTFNM